MNSEKVEKITEGRRLCVYVRLTEEQKNRLESDAKLVGWSAPTMLRESYFKKLPPKLIFDKDGESKFLAEFRRIGNNINQLAKAANIGDLVPMPALEQINEQLKILFRYVMRMDGLRQDSAK